MTQAQAKMAASRRNYLAKIRSGKCIKCGIKKPFKNFRSCEGCMKKSRARQRKRTRIKRRLPKKPVPRLMHVFGVEM